MELNIRITLGLMVLGRGCISEPGLRSIRLGESHVVGT